VGSFSFLVVEKFSLERRLKKEPSLSPRRSVRGILE
jgi:hypothetical protein